MQDDRIDSNGLRRTEPDLEKLAEFLDAKYQGPLGFRFGWDGLIGLIPGFGDFATSLASTYIIGRAAMIGVSLSVLLRMAGNVFVDNVIGAVPFLGWIGDFFWKSNLKNIELLRRHAEDPRGVTRSSRLLVTVVIVLLTTAIIGFAVLTAMLAWWLLRTAVEFFQGAGAY